VSLTTAEAAARLHLGEPAVRQLVHRGHLRPIRPGARPLEFTEAEVDAYQQRRWREQQRRAQLGDAWAECERLLAGQR
jgi:excisionase family DNA binding protein